MKKDLTIDSINHHSRRQILAPIDLDDKGNPMPSMSDQDQNLDTDIIVILARYRKTGGMPEIKTSTALQYFDTTQVPSFQDAQNRLANAKTMFEQLPAQLRFYMDNDFTKAESFFKDPRNTQILKKHGFLEDDMPHPIKTDPAGSQTPQNTPPAPSVMPDNKPKEN